jgi:hypothetical protein
VRKAMRDSGTTIFALFLLGFGIMMAMAAIYVLFNIKNGKIYFMEWIYKEKTPVQYWAFAVFESLVTISISVSTLALGAWILIIYYVIR